MYDEFPHEIIVLEQKTIPDGRGGSRKEWTVASTIYGFMDTPTSKELLYAMQMAKKLDRYLYYPFGQQIDSKARLRFENVDYELAGEGEDQGGMNEIMRVALKKVA